MWRPKTAKTFRFNGITREVYLKNQIKIRKLKLIFLFIFFITSCREESTPDLEPNEAEVMLRNVEQNLVFRGTLDGEIVHLAVHDCMVFKIDGEEKNMQLTKVLEPKFYPFSNCQRQFLKAENGAVTVWLGRMAFGAGGCCSTGGTYRTTDGIIWKKVSQYSSPF